MKSKSFLILFLLLSFFSVIITFAPAFAATTQQQPAFAAEQLPAWLTEAGAVPVSDVALENVQGEFVFTTATLAVYYYIVSTGYCYFPTIYAFLNNMAQHGVGQFSGIYDWIKSHK